MDAFAHLRRLDALFAQHKLEAVMIGNAAAAIRGAPVTTVDFDFFLRETDANFRKIQIIAQELEAPLDRPFYPASKLLRIERPDQNLQIDFMTWISGKKSFEGVRSRALRVQFDGPGLLIASLVDIIESKRAAGRPQDLAILPVLEATLEEEKRKREEHQAGAPPGE